MLFAGVLIHAYLFDYVVHRGEITGKENARVHYRNMVSYHARMDRSLPPGSVLFIGDSHIQSLAVSAVCSNSANFGIGGDSTDGILARVATYESLGRAAGIILLVGFNDLAISDNRSILSRYELILATLPSEIPVLVCGLFPVSNKHSDAENLNGRIANMNRELSLICERSRHWRYAGPRELGIGEATAPEDDNYERDGIHLSRKGYSKLIAGLRAILIDEALVTASIDMKTQ